MIFVLFESAKSKDVSYVLVAKQTKMLSRIQLGKTKKKSILIIKITTKR